MPDDKQDAEKYRFFQEGDERYAAKIVERIVFWACAAIGLAIVGAALKIFLNI